MTKTTNNFLVEKWGKILKDIEDPSVREMTAVLLENQAAMILHETAKENGGILTESTNVGQIGTFQKFAFPLIRRIFPELIANKICGVQPMSAPVSQVFYLGHDRVHGAAVQTVYSKYNITYANKVAVGNGNVGSLDTSTDTGGVGNKSLSSVGSGAGFIDGSATVGGSIAAWPSGTAAGYNAPWSTSAGEALAGTSIPEINFHIEQQAVLARTRKFRALWTIEAAQDLRAYHGISLEKELTGLLGNEVRLEIDRELIEDVRNLAYDRHSLGGFNRGALDLANSNNFAADGFGNAPGSYLYQLDATNSAATTLGTNPATTDENVYLIDFATSALGLAPRHVGEVYANLIAVIQFASQDIYKTTWRGAGNFIVTSPFVAAILWSAAKLEGGAPPEVAGQLGNSITYKGKWMGQFDVYVDPLYPEDELLIGYKGASSMDSGFIYCPYVPLQMLPTITDPETFQPRKGLITRYGKVAVSPESRFYRVIRIIGANANYLTAPFGKAQIV